MATWRVCVNPNARQTRILKGDEARAIALATSLASKAQKALLKLLLRAFGILKSRMPIKSSQASRHELIAIEGDGA